MSSALFSHWIANQKPRAHNMRNRPVFYQNLEEALDVKRKNHGMLVLMKNTWTKGETIDFCSNDSLSFGASGLLRQEFEAELARNPGTQIGASGSRLLDGNYDYIEAVEQEIADYHGVEAALIVGSGCDGNYVIFEAIPRPGDAIVYDKFSHASIRDGISRSLASTKVSFAHNNVDALREVLISLSNSQPLLKHGKKCVLIVVESFYSMEGDMPPLEKFVQVAKEIFPSGNAQFIVDEAHSMGVVGERGLGFVHTLALDSEVAIKTHTFSKAFGSIGGVILGNQTVKSMLINFSRSTMFTCAPAFHQIAAIRAAYTLMQRPEAQIGRDNIQNLVKRFFTKITAHPIWEEANDRNIISIPLTEGWEERDFQTQLIPLWTREKYGTWLTFHLGLRSFSVFPVTYPVVPKGNSRLRVVIHALHTEEQIDGLVAAICEWAEEMIEIEMGTGGKGNLPWAAKKVFMLTTENELNGAEEGMIPQGM